ncbi:MAG: 4Fe-4S binding protein [Candidatus Margulisbacteria bacterium]|nr:4Fe-4S binding protein [Candidatus Margulisiibacteriota bacterium]MBU1617721.1 4Fe-4S binding protein [Candidatus Margulisiibacteriota bacterium]MBU1866854.1 4Fe-4S binding protein [Candidatus Margulisiibacteriota bacterium]
MAAGQKAVIDETTCTGCGICIDVCPKQALDLADNVSKLARPEACDGNGACADACPVQAITLK